MAAEAYLHVATGTGGKYPKRSHQRRAPSTLYARPPAPGGSHRWLPKVLDPALKLFSSVLRRTPLQIDPPSPASQGITYEPKEVANDMTPANPSICEDYEGVQDGETQKGAVGGACISKIEDIVKQKTFSRSEYNKLTELLRTRTVDLSSVNEDDRSIPNRSQPKDQLDKMKNASLLVHDNERGNSKMIESNLKHGTVLNVPEMEIASPAELAKAYMGSRPSRPLSSSTLKSSPLREIASFPDSSQKPAVGSVASRSVIRFSKLLENGHATPEFQGRSSLHKLPQSSTKGHSSVKTKGPDHSIITYPESVRFQMVSSNTGLSANNMNLKRRSSVLDIDTGSARRTRRKSSLVTPSKEVNFSPFRKPLYTPSPHQHRDSMDYATTPCLLDSARYNNTLIKEAEDRDDKPSCLSLASVPQQSSLMAKKILQQLDHLVPSPKERYREQKLGGRDGSTTKSSFTTYLSGMAVGSKDAESSKIFNVEGRPPSTPMVLLPDGVETSGPTSLFISETMMTSQPNAANGCTSSIMQAKPCGLVSVQTIPSSIASTPQNNLFMLKRAPESPLKLDAETNDSKAPSSVLIGKENKGVSIGVECSPVSSETEPQKTIYLFDSSKNNDRKVTEDNTSLSAVASPHSSDTPAVASSFRQPDPLKEDASIPAFSFGSKKSRSLVFSSTVARSGGSSGQKYPMKPELHFQIPMCISQVDRGAENVGEESPVFTFGSRSAATHPSNGVTKPNRCVFSFTTQVSSNPVSNLSGLDNSTIFGTSSSLVGLGTSKSDPPHTSPFGGACTTPLFNKSFSSPVQSDLKNLNGKPVGVSGLTSSFGFPAEAGSIFGFGISSGVGLDTSTPTSMPTSLLVGPGSLFTDIIRPPLQSNSKNLGTMPFEKSGSASLASFSTQENSVIGLIPSSSSTSHGSTAAHLVVSQASCSALEPSSSAHISYTASTAVFSSSFTFASFSVTPSASVTLPSMIGAPQAIASHPGGDQMKVDGMATFDTVQSCLAPASSDTSLLSPAPAVQSPIFHFGNAPSPALFQSHAIQPSGNSDSPSEGHFSIGSIGGDKSARRIIKVKRDRSRG